MVDRAYCLTPWSDPVVFAFLECHPHLIGPILEWIAAFAKDPWSHPHDAHRVNDDIADAVVTGPEGILVTCDIHDRWRLIDIRRMVVGSA